MRVCHVITKPELGGAQLTTLNILSNLPKDKYDISFITSPRGLLSREFADLEGVNSHFSLFLVRHINPIADIIAFIHIFLIYRSQKYNIIHTHSSKAGILGRFAARFAKIPYIVHTVHGWSFNDCQPVIVKSFFIFLERITAKFTTKIICVSESDLEIGLRYKIAPREKFVFIKYGIPLTEFRRHALNRLEKRKELGIDNADPVVGMISCLKPQKSPLDFVKACVKIYEKNPNTNFLLVGDGILRRNCKKILAPTPLNGRFIFAGWRRDVSEILDILDLVVLTSKWEGMPIAIIEALCKGKPVVVTDTGGTRELVRNGVTGYLTQPGSYEELADRVIEILRDKKSFAEMSRNALLSIDDSFDARRMVDDVDRLYRRLR